MVGGASPSSDRHRIVGRPKLSVVGEEAGQAGVGGRIDFKNVTLSGKEHLVYTTRLILCSVRVKTNLEEHPKIPLSRQNPSHAARIDVPSADR